MSTPNAVLLASLGYVAEQYRVVPIPPGKKGPVIAGWQHLRLTAGDMPLYFETACNIGIQTCEGLVDIDLDSPEARALAPSFLPATDRVCGRPGSPDSHWFYRCDPTPDPARFADPTKAVDGRAMLVELRSDGQQTMVPPSLHPSGEHVAWSKEGRPAIEHGGVLRQHVGRLAAAALLARHWGEGGSRHDMALAVAGALAHAGWDGEDAAAFVEAVAGAAGDEELGDRLGAVASTFAGYDDGAPVTGIPTLADLLEKRVVSAFVSWLALRDNGILRELEASGAPAPGAGTEATEPTYQPTDLGNGDRFTAQHRLEARFSFRRSVWFTWTGTHWQQDDMGAVPRMAAVTARSILREAANEPDPGRRKSLALWARQSEGQGRRDAMIRSAAANLAIDEMALDRDPWVLNCANGCLDLRTGTLHPHSSESMVSKVCRAEYRPEARCPTWLVFLRQIMRDRDDLVAFLQRAAGYSLTGAVPEDALFFLYGTGRNGKSTFIGTIRSILQDYAMQAAPDLILAKQMAQHPTALASLFGKRFVSTIESGQTKRLDEELVKQLTGGDAVRARRMREDEWEFEPTHKLWLAANHKPIIRGGDPGIWSRIKTVPFEVTIPAEDRDLHLDEKLLAESAGILAWMVEGCLSWQKVGLAEPGAVSAATSEYRHDMDTIATFVEDACDVGDLFTATAADLYAAYGVWCVEVGEKAASQKNFGMQLDERGYLRCRRHGGTRAYAGLRVRSPQAILEVLQ